MTGRQGAALVALLAALAAACDPSGDLAGAVDTSVAAAGAVTSTAAPLAEPPQVDRLVVVDDDGLVASIDRNGDDRVVLSEERELPFQPVWSPDSTRIAYASRAANPSFVVVDAVSGESTGVATESASFYFFWSPQGDRLGSLRNGPSGIVFEVVTAGDKLVIDEVDTGQPFYFSWSPAGDRVVAHVGADRLDVLSPPDDGLGPEALALAPGAFRAPQWVQAGVVGVLQRAGGQRLAVVAADGSETAVVTVEGGVGFAVSPDGERVAVISFLEVDGTSVSAMLQSVPTLPRNRLYVVDLATGEATAVTEEPALAFFWSPDGTKLLVMELSDAPQEVQLTVWEEGETTPGPSFRPEVSWVDEFLPFFDQYAQSMRLWAPDSSAYAFVGRIGDESGVWVAPADGGAPLLVSDGSWVSWSPS